MLGLGKTVLYDSYVKGFSDITGVLSLTAIDNPDTEFMLIQSQISIIGTGFSGVNELDQLGGNYSLKIDRVNSGGTVLATATISTVYAYKSIDEVGPLGYVAFSESNSDPLTDVTSFSESGSALIDIEATGVTTSGDNLYVFTLTITNNGYEDFTISTGQISLTT